MDADEMDRENKRHWDDLIHNYEGLISGVLRRGGKHPVHFVHHFRPGKLVMTSFGVHLLKDDYKDAPKPWPIQYVPRPFDVTYTWTVIEDIIWFQDIKKMK